MRSKIISFIIGGFIGFLIWSAQVKAWATPIGYLELKQYEIKDPEGYMEEYYVDIPNEISEVCEKYGAEYNICPEILEALVWRESRCTDVSNGNCKGYAQVNEHIHKDRMDSLGIKDIHDLDGNIHVATDLLSDLYDDTGNVAKSLDKYNGNKQNGNSGYAKQIMTVAYCLDRVGGD